MRLRKHHGRHRYALPFRSLQPRLTAFLTILPFQELAAGGIGGVGPYDTFGGIGRSVLWGPGRLLSQRIQEWNERITACKELKTSQCCYA